MKEQIASIQHAIGKSMEKNYLPYIVSAVFSPPALFSGAALVRYGEQNLGAIMLASTLGSFVALANCIVGDNRDIAKEKTQING